MGVIQNELIDIDRFIMSITKNPENDTYEFQIGIPPKWEFSSNDNIDVEVITAVEQGSVLKLTTKDENITFDDFVEFIKLIVDVNIAIEEQNKELNEVLNKQKMEMEAIVSQKLTAIEKMKENAFKTFEKSKNKLSTVKPNKNKKGDGNNEETND